VRTGNQRRYAKQTSDFTFCGRFPMSRFTWDATKHEPSLAEAAILYTQRTLIKARTFPPPRSWFRSASFFL